MTRRRAASRNSAFIDLGSADADPRPHTASHESAHFLLNEDHVNLPNIHNLLWNGTDDTNTVLFPKRITEAQRARTRSENEGKLLRKMGNL